MRGRRKIRSSAARYRARPRSPNAQLAIGAPVAPLGLLVAVETLPDITRTLGNVTMDVATTVLLARWGRDEEHEHEDEGVG